MFVQMGVGVMKQMYDCIIYTNLGLIGQLEGVKVWFDQWLEGLHDQSLEDLYNVWRQCSWSVVTEDRGMWFLLMGTRHGFFSTQEVSAAISTAAKRMVITGVFYL